MPRQKELKVRFDMLGLVTALRAKARGSEDGKVLPSALPSKTEKRRGTGALTVILNMVKGSSQKKPKVVPKWGGRGRGV